MKQSFKDTYITLDWDRITIEKAKERIKFIWQSDPNIKHLKLSLSPMNGYHVRIWFYKWVKVAELRRKFLDDGRRLVHDLIDNPDHIHDILWNEKEFMPGFSFFERDLIEWYR